MHMVKIGVAPTRRSIFSAPDALKYSGLIKSRLIDLGIDFVGMTMRTESGSRKSSKMKG